MADYERPPRVLVVEDDDAIAQVLKRSLRMEGYEVRVAEDGLVALEQAHGFLPDSSLPVPSMIIPGPRQSWACVTEPAGTGTTKCF